MTVMIPVPDGTAEDRVDLSTGIGVRILRRGRGRALVMVPGWTCSADFFAHQLAGLSEHYDVIAVDPRGQGGSDKPITGNTFTQRAKDLAALLDALDLDRPALFGWSFGVLDVLAYVRDVGTDAISAVIMCDETPTVPADPQDPAAWGEAPLTMDGIVTLLRLTIDSREAFWTEYAKEMIALPPETADDHPDVARIVELGMQTPEHVAVATMADGVATDLAEAARAADAAVPTMLMANDAWAAPARVWTERHLPNTQFRTMRCHMGFVTEPEEFNADIDRFLAASR